MELLSEMLGDLGLVLPKKTIVVMGSSKKAIDAYLLQEKIVYSGFIPHLAFRVQKGYTVVYGFSTSYIDEGCIEEIMNGIRTADKVTPVEYVFLLTKPMSQFISSAAKILLLNSLREEDTMHFVHKDK